MNWRPPRSIVERNTRAIRSMQNGSMDGRIVGSFPVKNSIPEDYDEDDSTEDEELENPGGPGKGVLRPATEYFRVGNHPDRVFNLAKNPYIEEDRLGKQYSTVHVYWNNIFQKDASFLVGAKTLYMRDPNNVLQDSDTITVKYWWAEGGGGDGTPHPVVDVYHLEGWFGGGEVYDRYGQFAANGLIAGSVGRNGGAIVTVSTLYSTVSFRTHFSAAIRLKQGDNINLDHAVDGVVLVRFPTNANVSVFGYESNAGVPGEIIARKIECGLGGETEGSFPASANVIDSGNVSAGLPVPGSVETHSGDAAINFAQLANVEADFDGNHQAIPIIMSDAGANGSNSGCGGFGDPTFFDDTLYGKWTGHKNTYDGTFGATIIIIREPPPGEE